MCRSDFIADTHLSASDPLQFVKEHPALKPLVVCSVEWARAFTSPCRPRILLLFL